MPEITNFWKICISKPQTWGKVQLLSLKFDQISVPRASNWTKNQFFKTPNLVAVCSLSPYFRPFWPHTHTKMKVEYPLPPGYTPQSYPHTLKFKYITHIHLSIWNIYKQVYLSIRLRVRPIKLMLVHKGAPNLRMQIWIDTDHCGMQSICWSRSVLLV